ncbi:MAG: RluA family pseudouridine synthase [Lachnospiraceae bacterium]|nr:RluA family pseudouridine synthase [Lachnospiraceae bacterium]
MKCAIIFEDDYIIICHKPAGFPTQTSNVGRLDCVSELKNYLSAKTKKPGEPYLGIVHRLDQPVEGLLVFAKKPGAAEVLSRELKEGMLNKRYYAVVDGIPPIRECAGEEAGTVAESERWMNVVDYLEKDARVSAARIVSPDKEGAKEARLQYRVMQTHKEQNISKIEVILETGRFHQIRAQMAHLGFPLLGDTKYGTGDSVQKSRELGVRNVALCAYSLDLEHPMTKERMGYICRPENPVFGLFES